MRRNLEICGRCRFFDDVGKTCEKSSDAIEEAMKIIEEEISASLKIPKDFFAFSDSPDDTPFEEKDIPDECAMKTEYCLDEWNKEKKS